MTSPARGVPGARSALRRGDIRGYRYAAEDRGLLGGVGLPSMNDYARIEFL